VLDGVAKVILLTQESFESVFILVAVYREEGLKHIILLM
jgi:hypothetical protein